MLVNNNRTYSCTEMSAAKCHARDAVANASTALVLAKRQWCRLSRLCLYSMAGNLRMANPPHERNCLVLTTHSSSEGLEQVLASRSLQARDIQRLVDL